MQEPLQSHRVLDEVGVGVLRTPGDASNLQGFLFCRREILGIIIQSGEAVESGLIVFRCFYGLKFGVLGRIKGSDMALGQN